MSTDEPVVQRRLGSKIVVYTGNVFSLLGSHFYVFHEFPTSSEVV